MQEVREENIATKRTILFDDVPSFSKHAPHIIHKNGEVCRHFVVWCGKLVFVVVNY